jgi:prepilin-type N-terminal cleavage/methylation domain-containing protein
MIDSTVRRRLGTDGFSLIEVMVTMVLLAVALAALGPVTVRVTRMGQQSTAVTQRSAALGGEVQRLEVRPFDSLAVGTTCTNLTSASFPRTDCVTVTTVNSKTKLLSVVVTPTGGTLGPDTAIVQRSKAATANPLNVP